MKLVIASNNTHKIQEIKAILQPYFSEIISMKEAGIDLEVDEDQDSFEGNAYKKALELHKLLPENAVLSDDSGLQVDALDGAPGVHSARFAGEGHDDDANNIKLLQSMQDVPERARSARFVSVTVLLQKGHQPIIAKGTCEGSVGYELRGDGGFGYDPLFIVADTEKTFAELTAPEKNQISHRARSLNELKKQLDQMDQIISRQTKI